MLEKLKALQNLEAKAYGAGYKKGKEEATMDNTKIALFLEDVKQCLSYACKEGHLDPEQVKEMTWKERLDYYDKAQAYEPPEEEETKK